MKTLFIVVSLAILGAYAVYYFTSKKNISKLSDEEKEEFKKNISKETL